MKMIRKKFIVPPQGRHQQPQPITSRIVGMEDITVGRKTDAT
jgi:hypothetical protein